MTDDWKSLVITPGIDTLLDYLAEEGSAPVSKVSKDLGVSEDRIMDWARRLEEHDFVDKRHSSTGRVLNYAEDNRETIKEKLGELEASDGQENSHESRKNQRTRIKLEEHLRSNRIEKRDEMRNWKNALRKISRFFK